MSQLFEEEKIERVVHLAAQAGVRHSLEEPFAYVDANVTGFLTVLEGCRHHDVEHLVYASTSSVYGLNTPVPISVARMSPKEHPTHPEFSRRNCPPTRSPPPPWKPPLKSARIRSESQRDFGRGSVRLPRF